MRTQGYMFRYKKRQNKKREGTKRKEKFNWGKSFITAAKVSEAEGMGSSDR